MRHQQPAQVHGPAHQSDAPENQQNQQGKLQSSFTIRCVTHPLGGIQLVFVLAITSSARLSDPEYFAADLTVGEISSHGSQLPVFAFDSLFDLDVRNY